MYTSEKDKLAVIEILCQSFKENKSVNFVVKQDHRKEKDCEHLWHIRITKVREMVKFI